MDETEGYGKMLKREVRGDTDADEGDHYIEITDDSYIVPNFIKEHNSKDYVALGLEEKACSKQQIKPECTDLAPVQSPPDGGFRQPAMLPSALSTPRLLAEKNIYKSAPMADPSRPTHTDMQGRPLPIEPVENVYDEPKLVTEDQQQPAGCHQKMPCWSWAIIVLVALILVAILAGGSYYFIGTMSPSTGTTTMPVPPIITQTSNTETKPTTITTTPTTTSTTRTTTPTSTRPTTTPIILPSGIYADCKDALSKGERSANINISPDGGTPFPVACDHDQAGGGWTVFQRRNSEIVSFNRGWNDYKNGFGSLDGNHWLGTENLHRLTYNRAQSLLVVLDGNKGVLTAAYGTFSVNSEADFYRLTLKDFQGGSARNALAEIDNARFSTPNRDHDSWGGGNCASVYMDGWWYSKVCNGVRINTPWGRTVIWFLRDFLVYPTHTLLLVRGA